jgi:hypothetical protein
MVFVSYDINRKPPKFLRFGGFNITIYPTKLYSGLLGSLTLDRVGSNFRRLFNGGRSFYVANSNRSLQRICGNNTRSGGGS